MSYNAPLHLPIESDMTEGYWPNKTLGSLFEQRECGLIIN